MTDELTAFDKARIVQTMTKKAQEGDKVVRESDGLMPKTRRNAFKNRRIARRVANGDS